MSKISVALATYNGEDKILRQLDSVLDQTRKPDEVIIIDDNSTDGTVNIIKKFIEDNQLDNWNVIKNETNLGWKENFKKAFDTATGDYIFPCDQDDCWYHNKIELMTDIMESDHNIELLVSNYNIRYEGTSPTENIAYIWNRLHMSGNKETVHIGFDEKWYYTGRPGCTYCFRKSFYDDVSSLWDTAFSHDGQLWRFASIRDSLYIYNNAMMDFWRYGNNSTSVQKMTNASRITELEQMLGIYERYTDKLADILNNISISDQEFNTKLNILNTGIEVINNRIELLQDKGVSIMDELKIYNKYKKYYVGIPAMLIDWKVRNR